MKRIAFVTLILFGAANAFLSKPDFSKVGSSGAAFLKIPTSARVVGLGGAYVALANDLSTLYINPAGVANIKRRGIVVSDVRWISDINYAYVGGVVPMKFGGMGFQIAVLTMGSIKKTTYDDPDGVYSGTFSANSAMVGLTYARAMTDKLNVGITAKYIHESISKMHSGGLAFDLGTYYNTGFKSLRIAMAVNNYGQNLQFTGEDLKLPTIPDYWQDSYDYKGGPLPLDLESAPYALPLSFRLGLAYDIMANAGNMLTSSLEILHPNDGAEKLSLGFEYTHSRMFFLRAGYKLDPDRFYDKKSAAEGISAGLGAKFNVGMNLIQLDYGFFNNGRLGFNHFFTIQYSL